MTTQKRRHLSMQLGRFQGCFELLQGCVRVDIQAKEDPCREGRELLSSVWLAVCSNEDFLGNAAVLVLVIRYIYSFYL